MLASSPIPKQTVGRTFFIAIIILGVVALIQLGAVGWAFIARFRSAAASGETHTAMYTPAPAPPKETDRLNVADTFAPDENAAPTSMPKPTPVSQAALAPPVSPTQGRQNELAEQAKTLRERGDMSTALTRLREAQALSADNPYILSEMALTYEKMDLKDKAMELWQRIHDMGKSTGSYYTIADAKLNAVGTAPAADAPAKADDGFQPGSVMTVLTITREDSADAPGKKFKLKVPLKAKPGSQINVNDVGVYVLFYEQLDDQSIVQTNANVTHTFTTSPVDWNQNDIQVLEVEYSAASLDTKAKHPENRTYYGYIVRVYYKGALQDMRADPVKLLKQYPPPLTLSNEDTQ